MSIANIIATIECSDGERTLEVTRFPNAPLLRFQIKPPSASKDGVVLDIHGMRELAEILEDQVYSLERYP